MPTSILGGGGGAVVDDFGTVVMTNSTLLNNSSGYGGGAVYIHGIPAGSKFINDTIYNNLDTGAGSAGGIWSVNVSNNPTLENTIVTGNTSTNDPSNPDTFGPYNE